MRRKIGNSLHKGRYAIALYDKDDSFIAILDNASELAEYLNRPLENMYPLIRHIEIGDRRYIEMGDRRLYAYLIDMEEEE